MHLAKFTSITIAIALVLFLTPSARATVTNASFESPDLNDTNNVGTGSATGWTTTSSGVGVFDSINSFFSNTLGNNAPLPAPADQGQMLFTNNKNTIDGQATQVVGTVAANTIYTLTVAVGQAKTDAVFGTYNIQLLAGATVIASAPATTPTADTFVDVSAISVALSPSNPLVGQNLTILLAQADAPANGVGVLFRQNFYNNVRLTAAVPEPASIAALGGIVLLGVSRRRAHR